MAPKGEVIEVPQHEETDPRVRRGFNWDGARQSVKTPPLPLRGIMPGKQRKHGTGEVAYLANTSGAGLMGFFHLTHFRSCASVTFKEP